MNNRLLTNKEMAEAFGGDDYRYEDMKAVCQRQRDLTAKAVRQEIGEWLKQNVVIAVESDERYDGHLSTFKVSTATYGLHTKEWWQLIESLGKGEMPE